MKRKIICALLFAAFIAVNQVTAQEEKNVISAGMTILGGNIGYERILGHTVSVGIETAGSFAFEINTYNNTSWFKGFTVVEGHIKLYPWQGMFFAKLGMGYHWEWLEKKRHGFLINPGVGWKIDIGKPGGFVLVPAIDIPLFIGKKLEIDHDIPFGGGIVAKLSLGYYF